MVHKSTQRSEPHHDRVDCAHDGYYSGVGLYSKALESLRYVLVCDDCGAEIKELAAVEYAPRPALATG
jgi:hypothetical protein